MMALNIWRMVTPLVQNASVVLREGKTQSPGRQPIAGAHANRLLPGARVQADRQPLFQCEFQRPLGEAPAQQHEPVHLAEVVGGQGVSVCHSVGERLLAGHSRPTVNA